MGDRIRFVDSIAAAPTTRLDLNDEAKWSTSSYDFSPPELRRSVQQTMLTDGAWVGASAYDNRTLKLTLELKDTSLDSAATQTQALIRELNRVSNILEWRPTGATNSMFFRTFRSTPSQIQDIVAATALRDHTIELLAEPFGVGTRVDVGSTTVSNNPASGSNGCFIDLTSVKGDVETPLVLTYGGSVLAGSAYNFAGLAIGIRYGAAPYPALFRQAESLTLGTDTTVSADANFSGGSKARCTFATNNNYTQRLSGAFPTASSPAGAENRGVYRVFARVQATTLSTFQLGISPFTETASSYQVQTYARTVDLGLFSAATAPPLAGGYESTEYQVNRMPTLTFHAQRTSGSGSLDIDYFLLIPADDRYGIAGAPLTTTASTSAVIDSVNEYVYASLAPFTATPQLGTDSLPVSFSGLYPHVPPGDSRVVIYQHTPADGSGVGSRITDSLSISAYYWPRYIYARPLAT